jgi:Zn-dependent protease with chaperone function
MPTATKVAHDPEIIARLQNVASRSPVAYRFRLVAIAIAGDFALTFAQVLPWAVPIVIGVFWANVEVFYWLGGAAIVFLAWMFRPTFRFEGRELAAEECQELREEVERLRRQLRVPDRMHLYLDDSFNASAAESRGLFGLLGTKCVLTLGVPLLMALTREQALAVIAHELGHFSRRHGRLGHWLYRARVGLAMYAHYVNESDSSFDRAAAWYSRKFVPFFSVRCFVHSRQCEYEADADAALAVGRAAIGEALMRTEVVGRLWEKGFPRRITDWQREHSEPPRDFYERFQQFIQECSPSIQQSHLEEALRAPSSWHDTHPSLSERLRSLAQEPILRSPTDTAGQALLSARWAVLCAEFNDKWVKQIQGEWLLEHLRLRHIVLPLVSADETNVRNWSADQRLARARALRASDPARGLIELKELYQLNPSHKRIKFAYAAALLNEKDHAGVEVMESLARADAAFRAPAFFRVLAFYEQKGDGQQIERWSRWLNEISRSLGETVSKFLDRATAGEGRPSSLPAGEQALISEAVRRDPCVVNAWLLEGDAQLSYATNRPAIPLLTHLLVLAVDLAEAKRLDQDEDSIAGRYESMLGTLVPPEQIPLVRTYLTTEPIPEVYRSRSDISLNTDAREEAARRVAPR